MTKTKLKAGEVLVKLRGGASRRVRVVRVGRLSAILEDLAPSNQGRRISRNLGEDGLPEGYRRA